MTNKHDGIFFISAIVQGSVYVYDNPGLCHWPDLIDWSELFERPAEQYVFTRADNELNGTEYPNNKSFNSFYFNEIPPLSLCGSESK